MVKVNTISVQGLDIAIYKDLDDMQLISLTDIVRAKDAEYLIDNWLSNPNTLEYLLAWEAMYNSAFNFEAFSAIRGKAGVNSFKISPKEWSVQTNAIGFKFKKGKHAGIYAHKDIAFNFCMWISPQFQLYVIKEVQRLKEIESNRYEQEWDVKRIVAKANYTLHTDAIKEHIIPRSSKLDRFVYTTEADMLNLAVFGCTAAEWRTANPERALQGENLRDVASINELTVLSNIESYNSILIHEGKSENERFCLLKDTAQSQLHALNRSDALKALKRTKPGALYDAEQQLKGAK